MRYLSRRDVADRLGIKPRSLDRVPLPPADVMIGNIRGWLPETIEAWIPTRPGRGYRSDIHKSQ